jgi:hypothetical protein
LCRYNMCEYTYDMHFQRFKQRVEWEDGRGLSLAHNLPYVKASSQLI